MICYDTEDDSKGKVTVINFYDGNFHTSFKGKNCRYKAWSYLHQHAPDILWACNAEYDLINLFGQEWITKLNTLQYVSAGFMRAFFREAKITYFDTLRHWPASVEAMGKIIGLSKLSMPHLGCSCDDCINYCQRDTEITWKFVAEMISRYESIGLETIRATLPSMALQLFLQFYKFPIPVLSRYHRDFIRQGYYGGRVEVYRIGDVNGTINHYDVNSLYPSVMKGFDYPSITPFKLDDKPNFDKEGIFEGWVNVPDNEQYPCLPYRGSEEIIYPTGNLYGTWAYPEIRQLLQDGGTVARCKQCMEFKRTEKPFDDYIDFCYDKRLGSKNEVDSLIWKLFMNSLYGKFASHKGMTIIYDDVEKTIETQAAHANVIWSAYCTSYARLRLLEKLRKTSDCYYTDTDSIFTPDELPTSTKLGDVKLEGIYKSANFKGNKLYVVDDKYKAKGVPKKHQETFFKTGKAVYSKPTRFRESRVVANRIPNYWKDVAKESHKEYSKRLVHPDGTTEPWNIERYKRSIEN